MPRGKDWKILNGFRGETEAEYRSVLKELRKIIDKNFDKYAEGGRLSFEDMNKRKRLTRMLADMEGSVNELIKKRNAGLSTNLGKSFKAAFKRLARKVEKDANIGRLGLEVPPAAPVVADDGLLASTKASNASTTRAKLKRAILNSLNKTTAQGDITINGSTVGEFFSEIKDMMGKDYNRFVRVINTEGTRVNGKGQNSVYTELGKNKKQIVIFETKQPGKTVNLDGQTVRLYGGQSVQIGDLYNKIWNHGGSKEPREPHLAEDGVAADEEGYFTINGYRVQAPGEFPTISENANCSCYLTIERKKVAK